MAIQFNHVTDTISASSANGVNILSRLVVAGAANVTGDLVVSGNVTLGDASTDTITLNGSTISLGNNSNIDSGTLFIDAVNNRVGVGTTAPAVSLQINTGGIANPSYNAGRTANNPLIVVGSSANLNGIRISSANYGNSSNSYLDLANFESKNFDFASGYRITGGVGSGAATSNPYLSFSTITLTTGGTISSVERVRVDASGNVGIGTTSPAFILDVAPASGSPSIRALRSGGADMRMAASTLATGGFIGTYTTSPVLFVTDSVERMRIEASGNVGIGITTPTSNLHVVGTANITSTLVVLGSNVTQAIVSGNAYANSIGTSANTWANTKLANTSGVVFAGDLTINGNVGIRTAQTAIYALQVNGAFAATTKSFLIDHPTKLNMKLRYASLEGPENGVYVRGRTKDKVIRLPDYWAELVDMSSITVNITPIGHHQHLYVSKIEHGLIYISSDAETFREIDYFYTVYAERKDVEKLVVEF